MMETESAMNRVNRNRQKILPERNVTMKFFHLSDLHIGLKLMNRDLREDQEYILSKIVEATVRGGSTVFEMFCPDRRYI